MSIREMKAELGNRFRTSGYAEFEVCGKLALFADPLVSAGGEKTTYDIPTYEALKGITKRIYWKPTFIWIVDEVRVMNPIKTDVIGVRLPRIDDISKADLANYVYLMDVKYQVKAHIEWNLNRPEYTEDRDYLKHYSCFAKGLLMGGRRPVFLGKSECPAFVKPVIYGSEKGSFDNAGHMDFGMMYHGLVYADEAFSEETRDKLSLCYSNISMENGIIRYPRPSDCLIKPIRDGSILDFKELAKEENDGFIE